MAKLKLTTENIVNCIVYGVIGLLLIILRAGSLEILMTIAGALLIVMGVIDLVKTKDTTKGIVEIAIGVAIIVCGWLIADIVLLVLGVLLVVKSVIELTKTYKKGFMANLSTIITLIIGVLLIIAKWTMIDLICIIAGAIFIINAVLSLFGKKLSK